MWHRKQTFKGGAEYIYDSNEPPIAVESITGNLCPACRPWSSKSSIIGLIIAWYVLQQSVTCMYVCIYIDIDIHIHTHTHINQCYHHWSLYHIWSVSKCPKDRNANVILIEIQAKKNNILINSQSRRKEMISWAASHIQRPLRFYTDNLCSNLMFMKGTCTDAITGTIPPASNRCIALSFIHQWHHKLSHLTNSAIVQKFAHSNPKPVVIKWNQKHIHDQFNSEKEEYQSSNTHAYPHIKSIRHS